MGAGIRLGPGSEISGRRFRKRSAAVASQESRPRAVASQESRPRAVASQESRPRAVASQESRPRAKRHPGRSADSDADGGSPAPPAQRGPGRPGPARPGPARPGYRDEEVDPQKALLYLHDIRRRCPTRPPRQHRSARTGTDGAGVPVVRHSPGPWQLRRARQLLLRRARQLLLRRAPPPCPSQ